MRRLLIACGVAVVRAIGAVHRRLTPIRLDLPGVAASGERHLYINGKCIVIRRPSTDPRPRKPEVLTVSAVPATSADSS